MAKTEAELIEAHRTTLEALTGKKAVIRLIGKDELILKTMSLTEIETRLQPFNSFPSLKVKRKDKDLINLKKLFCLFASYGHTHAQIQPFLNISYNQVRYYLRIAKNHLQNDKDFCKQYEQIKSILVSGC